MSILVTGIRGQVGSALLSVAKKEGLDIQGFDIQGFHQQQLNIADAQQVSSILTNTKPEMVINAAAYTAVDLAEQQIKQAFQVNRDGPEYLAKKCAELGIPLLHISTDYVFDGSQSSPYVEQDIISPASIYGKSKAEGEDKVRHNLDQHIILRTSWVFSSTGNNFVKTMLRLGAERDQLHIINDQHGCPTSAEDIASTLIHISKSILNKQMNTWGTYHYCLPEATTWFAFAQNIFSQWQDITGQSAPQLEPIPTSEYPTAATRPMNSVLDCSKFDQTFGIMRRPWYLALQDVLQEIKQSGL